MEGGREGKQWLNTGLTIKTAQNVVFEICSSAAKCCNYLCNLQERVRQKGKETKKTQHRELKI